MEDGNAISEVEAAKRLFRTLELRFPSSPCLSAILLYFDGDTRFLFPAKFLIFFR